MPAMTPQCKGFTLIELVVVIAIMGIVASIVIPFVHASEQRHREQQLRASLRMIRTAIDAYKAASDSGHIAVPDGGSGYPPTLRILVTGVRDQRAPGHGMLVFLRSIPRDPMAEKSTANDDDTWGKRSYASEADHPQPGNDVYDVYSLSLRKAMSGMPYQRW